MSTRSDIERGKVFVGPFGIADPPRGSGASLVIDPPEVPVGFGWSQEMHGPQPDSEGQDFTVAFINGRTELRAGAAIYVRANFWLVDPALLPASADGARGAGATGEVDVEALAPYRGLQSDAPGELNHVALDAAASTTGAALHLRRPGLVNAQRRIVRVDVTDGVVAPGDRIVLRFGRCCSLSVRNHVLKMMTNANEHAFHAVIGRPDADFDGAHAYELVDDVSGGWLLPGAAAFVHVVAPSRVRAGEEFALRLTAMDDVANRAQSHAETVLVTSTERPDEPVEVRLEGGSALLRTVLATPEVHRFTVEALGTTFRSAPVEVTADAPALRVLWGDYHGHSWRDDGTGEPSSLLDYARRAAGLDWYALTTHDAPAWPLVGAMRWDDVARKVAAANDESPSGGEPPFVTLPAYEWTNQLLKKPADYGGGHHLVLARDWEILLKGGVPTWLAPQTSTPRGIYREMIRRQEERDPEATDFMIVPHDLLCCNWWDLNATPDSHPPIDDAEQERFAPLAQVYSVLHGNHESPQEDGTAGPAEGRAPACGAAAPQSAEPWRAHSGEFGTPAELAGLVNGLKYGKRYGVAAGGDSHSGRPGSPVCGALTAVLAPEHTRDAIFDAMRARHTYATSGHRLLLELSSPLPDGGEAIMGDVVAYARSGTAAPELRWRVVSPLPLRSVRLVRVHATDGDLYQALEDRADPWKFVTYVVHERWADGEGPLEAWGTFRDECFDAAAWPYASYFLAVSHRNDRGHTSDGVGNPTADHEQDRGWTSPIFFRGESTAGRPSRSG